MILAGLTFYVFAAITVAAGFMVIAARNPVHSVLFLILAFFTSAGLFVLVGAEFLAMILVIVYVGAVAVLFLFVVMMLDINFVELREGFLQYLPIGALIGIILLIELLLVLGSASISPELAASAAAPTPAAADMTNTHALGALIYTRYIYLFQAAGMLLLIAMIGAIVLTLRHREGVRKQSIARQVGRRRAESVELKKIQPGQGI
jgi:NADH-quinone oxidoreductase subunit J